MKLPVCRDGVHVLDSRGVRVRCRRDPATGAGSCGRGWRRGGQSGLPLLQGNRTFEGFEDRSPVEVFRTSFWFTTFSDGRSLALRDEIGIDRIMVETDYPHTDSSWPDTQALLATQLLGVPKDEADKMTYKNAAALYRHPVTDAV